MRAAFIFLLLASCATKSVYEPQADREGIRLVVHQHFHEVEKCYLGVIESRPGAEGKVIMSWDIQPDGRVANAVLTEANSKIEGIGPCLVKAISAWQFPRLNADEVTVGVNYPFFFSENGQFKP